jgi:hypothetical protein
VVLEDNSTKRYFDFDVELTLSKVRYMKLKVEFNFVINKTHYLKDNWVLYRKCFYYSIRAKSRFRELNFESLRELILWIF